MPAHPGHPALQSLHTHLNELLFKSSWNRPQKQMICTLFFYPLCFIISCGVECSPVTCLSGKEGIGIAEPNLSSNLSYSQSKCLYLWLTGRFVFYKSNTREWQTHTAGVTIEKSLLLSLPGAAGYSRWGLSGTQCSSWGRTSLSLSWGRPPCSPAEFLGRATLDRLLQSEH